METKREIETVIAGKKMEANCMNIIPLAIILYLRIFSPWLFWFTTLKLKKYELSGNCNIEREPRI